MPNTHAHTHSYRIDQALARSSRGGPPLVDRAPTHLLTLTTGARPVSRLTRTHRRAEVELADRNGIKNKQTDDTKETELNWITRLLFLASGSLPVRLFVIALARSLWTSAGFGSSFARPPKSRLN